MAIRSLSTSTLTEQTRYANMSALAGFGVGTLAASGGTEVTAGPYKYHTFTSSGTLTVSSGGIGEVLIVGGGGAGGSSGGSNNGSSGGGAGGLIVRPVSLTAGSFAVTVGAGGAITATSGNNGTDTSIASLTAFGGGGGGGF